VNFFSTRRAGKGDGAGALSVSASQCHKSLFATQSYIIEQCAEPPASRLLRAAEHLSITVSPFQQGEEAECGAEIPRGGEGAGYRTATCATADRPRQRPAGYTRAAQESGRFRRRRENSTRAASRANDYQGRRRLRRGRRGRCGPAPSAVTAAVHSFGQSVRYP